MRLVEQPQLGAAGDQAGQRGAPPLPGRQLAHRHVARAGRPGRCARAAAATSSVEAPTVAPQNADVLGDREVGVQPVGVAEQADPGAHGLALLGQVEAEHRRRAARRRQQPGAQPQQRGLAGAVRPGSSTISPRRTVRVAPASAGKRSRTATTSTSWTTGSVSIGRGNATGGLHRPRRRRCAGAAWGRALSSRATIVPIASTVGSTSVRLLVNPASNRRLDLHTMSEKPPVSHEKVSHWDRPKPPHDWRWVVGGLGRTLIALGLMMFAFVAYQLWGTGIQTAQAQRSLSREFEEQLADTTPSHHDDGAPSTTEPAPPTPTRRPTRHATSPAPTTTAPVLRGGETDPGGRRRPWPGWRSRGWASTGSWSRAPRPTP